MFSRISAVKLVLILTGISVCTACSKSEKKPAPVAVYPAKITIVDGIKNVMNPDYPRDGRVTYDMIEELSIGLQEGDKQYLLTWPVDIEVANNGDIYISDWKDIRIQVYDKTGSFLRTIGRQGQGPGDFDAPFYFCLASEGSLGILDMRAHRVSILKEDGRYLKGFQLPGSCQELKIDGNDQLYFCESKSPEQTVIGVYQLQQYTNTYYRAGLGGADLARLFSFKGPQCINRQESKTSGSSMGGLINSVWAIHENGDLSIGFNETYEIYIYDSEGRPRLKFGRPYAPVKMERPKENLQKPYYKRWKAVLELLPKSWPVFSGFIVAEDDDLWVKIHSDEEKEGCIYDVFSPDGTYVKQVRMKHAVNVFKNGRAYSIVRSDENEIPMIKRFRLEERPPEKK